MANPFKSSYRKVKLPKSGHALEEFGGGKKGLVLCSDCRAVYYKKSWHHSALNLKSVKESAPVNFVLCPACQMIKNHQFEGQIIILNIPENLKTELNNLIKGYCERAYQADPMDRLIEIKKSKNGLVATTTENQLANKLAKKIKDTFKKVKIKTTFSKDPSDFVDIRVEFLSSSFNG